MGIFRQIASGVTGIPIPSGKRASDSTNPSSSAPSTSDDGTDDSTDDYGPYGTQTLRKVKRATRRIGDKGDGR